MGRCKYEKLQMLEAAFDEIRKLPDLKEPKPGIFYLKSQGFMHFHEKESKIWADVNLQFFWRLGNTVQLIYQGIRSRPSS